MKDADCVAFLQWCLPRLEMRWPGFRKVRGQVCKRIGVTEVTYYRWKKEYDGATRDSIKRLKELEKENGQLKRLLADQVVENRVLKDIAEGNF